MRNSLNKLNGVGGGGGGGGGVGGYLSQTPPIVIPHWHCTSISFSYMHVHFW